MILALVWWQGLLTCAAMVGLAGVLCWLAVEANNRDPGSAHARIIRSRERGVEDRRIITEAFLAGLEAKRQDRER